MSRPPPAPILTPQQVNGSRHSFRVDRQTAPATPHPRNRKSLESILDFAIYTPPSSPGDILRAGFLFRQILMDCKDANITLPLPPLPPKRRVQQTRRVLNADFLAAIGHGSGPSTTDADLTTPSPDAPLLLHRFLACIYENIPTIPGKELTIRLLLHALFPPLSPSVDTDLTPSLSDILRRAETWTTFTPAQRSDVYDTLASFSHDFINGFLVPFKAQGQHTPGVSRLLSRTSCTEVKDEEQGVLDRLTDLREACLLRDGHRCIVTKTWDYDFVQSQIDIARCEGYSLDFREATAKTEAAHIIPHALNALGEDGKLSSNKHLVWRVLNMFDPGISEALQGSHIDHVSNAILLSADIHQRFDKLHCYFEETSTANVYTFCLTPRAPPLDRPPANPVLFHGTKDTVPNPRFLKIHRACALIMTMSGAAEYVERVLDDAEDIMCKSNLAVDGTTTLGALWAVSGIWPGWGPEPVTAH